MFLSIWYHWESCQFTIYIWVPYNPYDI